MEDRIAALESAHRALAARNEALFQIAKVMFALVPANTLMLDHLLNKVETLTHEHMRKLDWDADFCEQVAESMLEIREVIQAGESVQ